MSNFEEEVFELATNTSEQYVKVNTSTDSVADIVVDTDLPQGVLLSAKTARAIGAQLILMANACDAIREKGYNECLKTIKPMLQSNLALLKDIDDFLNRELGGMKKSTNLSGKIDDAIIDIHAYIATNSDD